MKDTRQYNAEFLAVAMEIIKLRQRFADGQGRGIELALDADEQHAKNPAAPLSGLFHGKSDRNP